MVVLQNKLSGLSDYIVHCFNGVPKLILVCKDRYTANGLTEDFFDVEWKHLNVQRPRHPNSDKEIKEPKIFKGNASLGKTNRCRYSFCQS